MSLAAKRRGGGSPPSRGRRAALRHNEVRAAPKTAYRGSGPAARPARGRRPPGPPRRPMPVTSRARGRTRRAGPFRRRQRRRGGCRRVTGRACGRAHRAPGTPRATRVDDDEEEDDEDDDEDGTDESGSERKKQLKLRALSSSSRGAHRRRGDRKGSAISGTPRSGPQAVKDALKREARRAVSLTAEDRSATGGLRGGPCPGPSAASRRAALALDKARPFGPVSATRRCSGISSVRSWLDEDDVGEEVAEIVSPRGLGGRRCLPASPSMQKTFGEKGREASFFSRSPGGLRPRWREGARGAVLEHPSEARSAEVRAPIFAPAVPAPQRRVGVADASVEERPGAALARDVAGPRSAAREHQRRVQRRARESRCQALQRPRGARSARPRRCRPNSVRPAGLAAASDQRAEAMPPEARGACA